MKTEKRPIEITVAGELPGLSALAIPVIPPFLDHLPVFYQLNRILHLIRL